MNTQYIKIVLALICIAVLLSIHNPAIAQSNSRVIDAQVKISICGNDEIEGGEDCEGNNIRGLSCKSLGYSAGTLSCDIACTFDLSNCINNPTPTKAQVQNDDSTGTTSLAPTSSIIPTSPPPISLPRLPAALQIFDIDGSGKITLQNIPIVVKLWVDEWKKIAEVSLHENSDSELTLEQLKKCDINNDRICDLRDFSYLMFYVER